MYSMQRSLCHDSNQKYTHCQQSNTGGNGCSYCKYKEINSRFEYLNCIDEYDYTYINNTLQCLRNYGNNNNIRFIYLTVYKQFILKKMIPMNA